MPFLRDNFVLPDTSEDEGPQWQYIILQNLFYDKQNLIRAEHVSHDLIHAADSNELMLR